jgi:hypothetical protein
MSLYSSCFFNPELQKLIKIEVYFGHPVPARWVASIRIKGGFCSWTAVYIARDNVKRWSEETEGGGGAARTPTENEEEEEPFFLSVRLCPLLK